MQPTWVEQLRAWAPGQCAVCAAWPSAPLCSACRSRFEGPRLRCMRCALAVPEGVAECGACVRAPPPLDACWAAVPYAYPWSGLISRFKFQAEPAWAACLAGLLTALPAVRQAVAAADCVVPIPLARARLAARGFNQALELARQLGAGSRLEPRLLLRLRDTLPQVSLDRSRRLTNVRGAFGLDPLRPHAVRGLRVLLVDDVLTTGASLAEAARALRAAGAGRVEAAVVARADGN